MVAFMAADCETLVGSSGIDEQPPSIISWSEVIIIVVLIAGFAGSSIWLSPFLDARIEHNALSAAKSSGALLYTHNFGIGSLIGVFAWIFISGFVGLVPTSVANDDWTAAIRVGLLAAVLTLISIVVTVRELNSYTLYFADRYEERHTFQINPTIRRWADASLVEVGCSHTDDGDLPIYRIHFKDKGNTMIDSAWPVARSWVSQMETIDASLVRAGARFEPWSWLDNDPYSPSCLMAYSSWLSPNDFARFQRLIRAPEVPRDVITDGPRR